MRPLGWSTVMASIQIHEPSACLRKASVMRFRIRVPPKNPLPIYATPFRGAMRGATPAGRWGAVCDLLRGLTNAYLIDRVRTTRIVSAVQGQVPHSAAPVLKKANLPKGRDAKSPV